MSNNINLTIQTLPVELLHRIFDNLNTETILFSIRPVCRSFRCIVNAYNRYVLDLQLISKPNFHVVCRLINPQNVISLTLSNDERTSDQIDLFISLVHLSQFTRLHSLILIDIDEFQLNVILKRINLNAIKSFSFNIRKYDNRRMKTTNNLFTSIIAQSSLRSLELDIEVKRMSKFSWPINSSIEYLILKQSLTMDSLCTILQRSPRLHTLCVKESLNEIINNIALTFSSLLTFPQLTSLTIEKFDTTIDKLELFLSLTPSLVYLKLIGDNTGIPNGQRWEQFIEINLPHLDTFEFFFDKRKLHATTPEDLELMITSFRTPFWTELKKWYVTCEYEMVISSTASIYSIPICKSHMSYQPEWSKVSLSTYPMIKHNDVLIQSNVNSLNLSLSNSLIDDIQKQNTITNRPLFPKMTKINMFFYDLYPPLSLDSISVFINMSQIIQMNIDIPYSIICNENILMNIGILVTQAHNLLSFTIESGRDKQNMRRIVENIHSIIPCHVKHLRIPVNDPEQIKGILERCQHLSTIQLDLRDWKYCEYIIRWFTENTINSTCSKDSTTVSVWLGKKKTESTDIKSNQKRIKLSEDV